MKKAPKIKGYKGGGDVYGTEIDTTPAKLTPKQWEEQNTKLGYLKAPGYSSEYGGFYNPKEYYVDDKGGFTRLSDKGNVNVNYNKDPNYKPVIQYGGPKNIAPKVPISTKVQPAALTSNRTAFDFQYAPQGYTGYKYDDGTIKYLNATGEEMPTLNKGGLVKGYAEGGSTSGSSGSKDDKTNWSAVGAAIGTGSTVIGGEVERRGTDEQGRYKNTGSGIASNALKYGGLGTSIGTAIAPGIGTAIGAGVGVLGGSIYGGIQASKDKRAIAAEQQAMIQQQADAAMAQKRLMIESKLANTLYDRNLENYADGGKVVGPGTGKSDSIPAKVEPGSHIVPVENAPVAEEIRKKVLKAPPTKKANLNQSGGVEVRLSNGEVAFSPEEKAIVEDELGEGVLDMLSPNAEDKDEYLSEKHKMKHGGKVKPPYCYAKGGSVGGDDDYTKKEKERIRAEREAENKKKAEAESKSKRITEKREAFNKNYATFQKKRKDAESAAADIEKLQKEYDSIKGAYEQYKNSNSAAMADEGLKKYEKSVGYSSRPESEAVRKRSEDYLKMLDEKSKELDEAKGRLSFASNESNYFPKESKGDESGWAAQRNAIENPMYSAKGSDIEAANTKPISKAPSVRSAARTAKTMPSVTFNPNDYANAEDPNLQPPTAVPVNGSAANNTTPAGETPLSASAREAEANYVAPNTAKKSIDWGNIASSAINYGLPLYQAYLGRQYLKEAGPRPVDQIDPDFLGTIDNANQATKLAQKNAQFGFTPEEAAALNQRNQNLTNAGMFAARNFSGGSAANALTNTRSALADAYGRNLQTQVQDRNLMLQKQDIANERQQYANDLIARKAEMQRRLFTDSMSGWQQNQQSGSDLLHAGLSNLVGANRYEQEKKAIADRERAAGSWTSTI